MSQRDSVFKIKSQNKQACLEAIKKLHGKETYESHFSWVDEDFYEAKTLEKAFECWNWKIELDDKGEDVVGIYFEGKKLGDDELLFTTIAPFVESGSYIEMEGEECALWCWNFSDGKMVEKYPNIDWE